MKKQSSKGGRPKGTKRRHSDIGRLSHAEVSRLQEPGYYPDGGNLYLQVGPTGNKSWIFKFTLNEQRREMGLGAFHTFSLADARMRALEARKLLADKQDPLEARRIKLLEARQKAASVITFDEAAARYIKTHEAGWKNVKSVAQWRATIATYVSPHIGSAPVHTVDTAALVHILEPLWNIKRETASRLRGRIEKILDWATALKYRTGENPARYKGNLDHLLTKGKRTVVHHPALPYKEIGAFMETLRPMHGMAALALQFLILTGTRTSEVLNARISEIDAGVWTIPEERMKAGRAHTVPLSNEAMAVLQNANMLARAEMIKSDFIFAGGKGRPLSNMACLALLKRIGRTDLTVHGFRSTFRDWCAESTNYPRDVAEMALAHTIGDKVEAAYRRGDLFEKRTRLMADWGVYCATANPAAASVVPMRRAKA